MPFSLVPFEETGPKRDGNLILLIVALAAGRFPI
jgi:hypothetical protein